VGIERETKLLVGPEFELPNLDALVDGVRVAADEEVRQTAVYFDTPDLRLTSSSVSLRYRSDDGWTVKLPEAGTGAGLVRAEHTFRGAPDAPPEGAVDLVRAWARTAPLEPVANVTTRRHRYTLTDGAGTRLAEIDDDRVEAVGRGTDCAQFREIEVELDEDAPARLGKRLAKRLRHSGETQVSKVPKVARAVGVQAVGRHASAAKGADVKTFVCAVLDDSVQRLIAHDPVIRIGEDSEGVHQARVATRKLRSHLRMFRPLIDGEWGEQLRDELRWLGELLGRCRDVDVLAELLHSTASAAFGADGDDTAALFDALARQGARDRSELLEAMRSPRYATLLDALVDAARDPRLRAEVERKPAANVIAPLARRQWHRFRKAVRRLGDEPADAELHKVRRRAKQARYALEAAADLVAGASRAARLAERLQGDLGDHQDCVVARQWLADAARDHPDAAFAAGQLAGLLCAEQRDIRDRARKDLRAVTKTRVG
jgi:CHAD domain-containing protein